MEKIFYLHSKPQQGKPRFTIAGQYNGTTLNFSVARCSEKDQFEKKRGRLISAGRLRVGKLHTQSFSNEDRGGNTFVKNALEILKELK